MELLTRAAIGRLAVSIGALPAVFPVGFGLLEQYILLRTVPGTKLDAATVGAVVAFQADGFEPDGTAGWTVLVRGMASAITEPSLAARAAAVPMKPPPAEQPAARFVQIDIGDLSGRRFGSVFDASW